MKQINHNFKVGDKLYWFDEPTTLAGIIVGFTPKRDVLIDFVSGRELGIKPYPIKLAKEFICKD
jgi:hypothetical protein